MDTLTKKQKHQGKDEEGENSLEALWGESHGTHACPQKHHYQEALPRLLPSHYWQWIPALALSAQHNCFSGQFVTALLLHHSSVVYAQFLSFGLSLLSLCLFLALCVRRQLWARGRDCRALWWGWGAEVSLRLKVWIALRCLAASFGSKFEGLRSAHTLGKETKF